MTEIAKDRRDLGQERMTSCGIFRARARPRCPHSAHATGPGWIRVGVNRGSVVLLPDDVVKGWAPGGVDALTEGDYAKLLDYRPKIVLLRTAAAQRFPHPAF
jgi:uncharacterized protein